VAAFRSGPNGCSLVSLPRTAFLSLFSGDHSMLAEVKIKLLRDRCALDHLLDHKRSRSLFSNFVDARRMGMSKCLDFHKAVESYCKVESVNLPAAFLAISQSVVGEFVMRRSPNVVPMSDAARRDILAAHSKGAVPSKLFLVEDKRIFDELEEVDLPAFTTSRNFQEHLTTIGANSNELLSADADAAAIDRLLVSFESNVQTAASQASKEPASPSWAIPMTKDGMKQVPSLPPAAPVPAPDRASGAKKVALGPAVDAQGGAPLLLSV